MFIALVEKNVQLIVQITFLVFSVQWNGLITSAAAATAKSLQSCPTLCDPIDGSPLRLPLPWDSPGKNTGVGLPFPSSKHESKN